MHCKQKEKESLGLVIINRSPSVENLNDKIMMMRENEKSMRTLAMLRYQADRYQSVGNGSMCQRVNAEIRRLVSQMSESSKN